MAFLAESGDVCVQEAMAWLPAHVFDSACEPKELLGRQYHHHHYHHRRLNNTYASPLPRNHSSKSESKRQPRPRPPRYPINGASGGPGMQAIFLDSRQRSCGTGVFLPPWAGTNFQPTKKPACSPVLLPSRVVQALNLNVHALACSQITPQRRDVNSTLVLDNDRSRRNSVCNKNCNGSSQCCVSAQSRSSSPEIFLPKEWTY
ncbi:PREDICTED: uncharacterized protein LOC104596462 [Nelumbo nucifera]|uniref:Uncharacterized protein n=2 Tax=Nelumbo nucifera TaxID=4432 RepID=A0A822XID9_NELNU|nr:PREDICTED: uncharacterized protein LOC104596462 [Nelumbo nucifera]DAD19463.1 TPA_asm: hypothetical protein HUJ06_020926 [Nelumbo nucifera]